MSKKNEAAISPKETVDKIADALHNRSSQSSRGISELDRVFSSDGTELKK